jgi:hypothetical protein
MILMDFVILFSWMHTKYFDHTQGNLSCFG